MTAEAKVAQNRLTLLQLAEKPGNLSAIMMVARTFLLCYFAVSVVKKNRQSASGAFAGVHS
jgi:hypothetical protein